MKASHCLLFMSVAWILVFASCDSRTTRTPDAVATPAAKEYDIKGKIAAIASDNRSVTLDHEDIPGLMKGMKMEFRVEEPGVLQGIEVGDQIDGQLRVQDGTYTIQRLSKR